MHCNKNPLMKKFIVRGGDDGRSAVLARGCFNGCSDLELMAADLRMER